MEFTLENVKKINSENRLTKFICDYIIEEWDFRSDVESHIKNLIQYCGEDGSVDFLLYDVDCVKFFKEYREEIAKLFYEQEIETRDIRDFNIYDWLCAFDDNKVLVARYAASLAFEYFMTQNFDWEL